MKSSLIIFLIFCTKFQFIASEASSGVKITQKIDHRGTETVVKAIQNFEFILTKLQKHQHQKKLSFTAEKVQQKLKATFKVDLRKCLNSSIAKINAVYKNFPLYYKDINKTYYAFLKSLKRCETKLDEIIWVSMCIALVKYRNFQSTLSLIPDLIF